MLDNAVNYTNKGQVSISFKKEKKRLKISISDTGIGMSSADKANIFEKFSRGTRAVSVNPNGSGLGLYIANQIMKAHGSGIKIEKTEINKGTVFSFHLKISNETKESNYNIAFSSEFKLSNEKLRKNANNKNINILMVEDEDSLLRIYKKFFTDNNCKFTASTQANGVLQKIKKDKFDVVILDIMLKKDEGLGKVKLNSEEGWDVLSAIKKDKTLMDLPVIIFSNLNSQKDKNKAKELGADNFLFKENTSPRKLLEMIIKILNKNRK